jgi:hypothetical protein
MPRHVDDAPELSRDHAVQLALIGAIGTSMLPSIALIQSSRSCFRNSRVPDRRRY